MHWFAVSELDIPAGDEWLVPRERARRDSYRFTKRRTEYLLRRYAGKRGTASALGWPAPSPMELGRLGILNRPTGAPHAELDGRPAPFDISLTDRAGHAVCLVGDAGSMESGSLGVDLEIVEPRSADFVADYLVPREQEWVRAVARRDGPDGWEFAANLLWSAKEAALKVLRVGLRADTRIIDVHVSESVDATGWGELLMHSATGDVFPGWWRRDGLFVLTIATRTAVPPPRALPGSEDLAGAAPLASWLANPRVH